MKKLMTVIASVALAFGLYAADDFVFNKTDFKDMPVGPFNVNMDDKGGEQGTLYWAGDAGDSEIKEAEDATKFLAIENSAPLFRTVNGQTADPQEIGTGVFADMYVKFTASDAADPVVLADGSKLGIWVAADEEAETPTTNLMVCAASLVNGAKVPVATNFTIAVGADFDFKAEHRVTIRAIEEISEGKLEMAGFVLYIDEELVAAADADYADKIGFTAFNSVAKPFYDNNQLFVSLVKAGTDDAQTIFGVGFKGTGELSKVALADADHAPEFAKPAVDVTIAWGDGIKSFTYMGTPTNVTESGSVVVTLASPTVPVTLSDVIADDDYVLGEIKEQGLTWVSDGVWAFESAPASLTMTAGEVAFTIGDKKYATFEDALAAAQPGDIIKLAKDCAGWEKPIKIEDADVDVILDLNGETLTFEDYLDEDMFEVSAGKLTVIDSGNGGKIAVTVDAESAGFYGVFYADGDGIIQIGLDEGDNGVTVDGLVGDGLTILKGLFLKDENDQGDLENFIDEENYEVVEADDYWKVQKKGGPEPTTYLLTVTQPENGTISVSPEAGKKYKAGEEISVSATANDGYSVEKIMLNGDAITGNTFTMPEEDAEVTASITANVYKVTFDTGDGEAFADQEYTFGTGDITLNIYDGTLTGYTFGGWTNVVEGGAIIANGGTLDNRIGGYALTAVWEKQAGGYPPEWPETDEDTKAKFAAWVADKGAGADLSTDDAKDAFLLNCAVKDLKDAKDAFKITSIEFVEGAWVIGEPEGDFNGKVVTKAFDAVVDGKEVTEPTGDETELFWKAFLVFPPAAE